MSSEIHSTFDRLPSYLQAYVVDQNYEKYTPLEHSTWRYILRQSRHYFKDHAHPAYLEGLRKTGVSISKIPKIEDIDRILQDFGWGAVCVCGFIPPLIFLDFQARKVLPIAADMRSLDHLAYTPAPDIVHEAAGHAPIIADQAYARYLTKYATLARKAIFSDEDMRLYEAIRTLSDVKENPDSTQEDIDRAELGLQEASNAVSYVSEAAKVARMNWWTVEYGLVGELQSPKIFGAGLLSSLEESKQCFSDQVKKIPLSLACINQAYDITRSQPQLFVAENFEHLTKVLHELEEEMSFKVGGGSAIATAKKAKTLTTTELDSGVQVSGVVEQSQGPDAGLDFIKWSGGVQLCIDGVELVDHGVARHPQGFSCPLGYWVYNEEKEPFAFSDEELKEFGLEKGKVATIKYTSGFVVSGVIKSWLRSHGKLLLITFSDCSVKQGQQVYFEPEWGEFDLALASSVSSVYGGPGDWESYGDYDLGTISSSPSRNTPFSDGELACFQKLKQIAGYRKKLANETSAEERVQLSNDLSLLAKELKPQEQAYWLIALELLELAHSLEGKGIPCHEWSSKLQDNLVNNKDLKEEEIRLSKLGLELLELRD